MIRKAAGQSKRSIRAPNTGGVAAIPTRADPLIMPLVRDRDRGGTQCPTVRAQAGCSGAERTPMMPRTSRSARKTDPAESGAGQADHPRQGHEDGRAEADQHQGKPGARSGR